MVPGCPLLATVVTATRICQSVPSFPSAFQSSWFVFSSACHSPVSSPLCQPFLLMSLPRPLVHLSSHYPQSLPLQFSAHPFTFLLSGPSALLPSLPSGPSVSCLPVCVGLCQLLPPRARPPPHLACCPSFFSFPLRPALLPCAGLQGPPWAPCLLSLACTPSPSLSIHPCLCPVPPSHNPPLVTCCHHPTLSLCCFAHPLAFLCVCVSLYSDISPCSCHWGSAPCGSQAGPSTEWFSSLTVA